MNNDTQQWLIFFIFAGFVIFVVKGCMVEHSLISTACSTASSQACQELIKETNK